MIGKIKNFNFFYLFILIFVGLIVISFIFNNYLFVSFFIIFSLISYLTTKYGLKIIKKLKLLQNIGENAPSLHSIKQKTPTMGGIFIILPFLLFIFIINIFSYRAETNFLFFSVLGFFTIGFLDDYLSIKNKKNKGLKSRDKFLLQSLVSIFLIILAYKNGYLNPVVEITRSWSIDTKTIIFPISFLTLVGLSNAVNLTDGLDGLASGCSSLVFFGLGTEILLKGQKELIIFSLICYSMSGLCIGFLKFNKYPAQIFMGDTGSLTIGAILGSIAILSNSLFTTFFISSIFLIETLSVIIQVSFFKITKKLFKKGKRIFLMTPIHHHFELMGIKEEKLVENFWKANTLLVILGIFLKTTL